MTQKRKSYLKKAKARKAGYTKGKTEEERIEGEGKRRKKATKRKADSKPGITGHSKRRKAYLKRLKLK